MAGRTPAGGAPSANTEVLPLDGSWEFRLDGEANWRTVRVPHTWQVENASAGYLGVAWYRREFDAPAEWNGRAVRIEFEAVYHSAIVSLNGARAGEHRGKGYTAFEIDITALLRHGRANTVEVRVDNSFRGDMLPRGNSFDWTPDGGIYRPVRLLATPKLYIERIDVDAAPDVARGEARAALRVAVRNAANAAARVPVSVVIREDDTGRQAAAAELSARELPPRRTIEFETAVTLSRPRLWHFDHPHLYRAEAAAGEHRASTTFGIRKFEIRDGAFRLNGERVRLMGVERMAGSHPDYGMAEPAHWIEHDHNDLKELNCVFTRVHWPQDGRVLDYCDRRGILMQLEAPAWGGATFKGMKDEPAPQLLANGLEQLREMIARDRNHPCVVAWGLCNEVNGQNPPAQQFVRAMFREARRLDPSRLLTYASHSLRQTPERDVAGELDFISWNEYYGSWQKGTVDDVRRNLEMIHAAFPSKPVVVSEYGYCECAPGRDAGDPGRIEILRSQTAALRDYPYVAGLIFFCYNDYRTHTGDKGLGVMKQRVHGVVDLYGARKPSYEALREESSPVEAFEVTGGPPSFQVRVRARKSIPAYRLEGYRLQWVVYGFGGLPMERGEAPLPTLEPGAECSIAAKVAEGNPRRVVFDVLRPAGFSAATARWKPSALAAG